MRKIIQFACIFVVILASCTQEELKLSNQPQGLHHSEILSESEAIALAEQMYQLHYPNISKGRNAQVENIQVIKNRKSRTTRDSLIYVVNFANEGGYAMIAVPRIASPLIAVVENGNYNPENDTDNPGLQYYMECAEEYVANAPLKSIDDRVKPPGPPSPRFPLEKTDTTIVELGAERIPLLKVRWGANYPENLYAPYRRPAGCVPTAVAQIMSYYKPQYTLTYTFPDAEIEGEVLDWDKLSKINVSSYTNEPMCDYCYADEETHKMLGRLCREIGHYANADYTDRATWVQVSKIRDVLEHFLPSFEIGQWTRYYPDEAMNYLDDNPILMNGNGHAWVADDYYYKKTTCVTYLWDGISNSWKYFSINEEIINTVRFNWGLNGRYDGYYSGIVMSPWPDYTAKNITFIPITPPTNL